jgi:hypothetical protein
MADIDKEWDKIRGEIKVIQGTKARQAKDAASGQMSLFPVEEIKGPRNDPNKEAMERIAREKDDAKEKAKTRAAENEDFKDKRQPRSELIQKAEMAKIKADADARDAAKSTRAQSSMISPQGNTTAAGRGTAYAERPDNAYQKMADQQIQDSENRREKLAELKAKNASKSPSGGSGSGSMGTGKMNRDITKNYKKGGSVSSASSRGDGCAQRGKTKGRMV